jgi:hypothetical protein
VEELVLGGLLPHDELDVVEEEDVGDGTGLARCPCG